NRGGNDALGADELSAGVYRGRALHVAGALVLGGLDGEPTAGILAEARRRGLHTSLDTVFDASGRWERVLPALAQCDLVTPGQAEAEAISGELDPARAARKLRELGAGIAAVTLGPDGCQVAADDFDGRVPAVRGEAGRGAGAGWAGGSRGGRPGRARASQTQRGRLPPRRSAPSRGSAISPGRRHSRRRHEAAPEPPLRRRRPLLRRRRRPRPLRRGLLPL